MDDKFEKIEAFIKGKMPPDEMQSFQKKMEADQELAFEVELQRLEWEAMHQLREKDLRNKFKEWNKESAHVKIDSKTDAKNIQLPKTTKIRYLLPRIAAAAVVLLIFGFGGLYLKSSQYSHLALLEKSYTPPVINSGIKGADPQTDNLTKGIIALDINEYSKAIDILKQIPVNNTNYEKAQFLIGHAHFLKAKDNSDSLELDLAIKQFKLVADSGQTHDIVNQAEWYLLMAQLKAEQVDKDFIENLKRIASDKNHNYDSNAKQLLQRMESFWYNWKY